MIERSTSNVTKTAVLAALAEYDQLGQKPFLAKYGYGRATKYQLWHEGKSYDSKAIIGAAFGYLPGNPPPLRFNEFSGGLVYVVPVLKALGFSFDPPATTAARNPPWSRDELILALDLYHRYGGRDPGDTHPDVIALSALLREMAGGARPPIWRCFARTVTGWFMLRNHGSRWLSFVCSSASHHRGKAIWLEVRDKSNLSLDVQLEARASFVLCRSNPFIPANSFAASA